MKFHKLFSCFLVFTLFVLYWQNVSGQVVKEKSLLWKISIPKFKEPSYLFGTVHMICKEDYVWTKKMQSCLTSCNKVCFEMDLDDPSLMTTIALGMMDMSGKKLKDYFKEEDYNKLSQYVSDSFGMSISVFQQMKPMALISLFSSHAVTCPNPLSYETEIMKKIDTNHVEIIGLEDAQEQLDLFEQMPIDSIIVELLSIINNKSEAVKEYEQIVDAYKKQDINTLNSIIENSRVKGDNITSFLDNRNLRWISRMHDMMEQGSVFFAVGAGHLVGKNGLINLLRMEGYTITPVK